MSLGAVQVTLHHTIGMTARLEDPSEPPSVCVAVDRVGTDKVKPRSQITAQQGVKLRGRHRARLSRCRGSHLAVHKVTSTVRFGHLVQRYRSGKPISVVNQILVEEALHIISGRTRTGILPQRIRQHRGHRITRDRVVGNQSCTLFGPHKRHILATNLGQRARYHPTSLKHRVDRCNLRLTRLVRLHVQHVWDGLAYSERAFKHGGCT